MAQTSINGGMRRRFTVEHPQHLLGQDQAERIESGTTSGLVQVLGRE